MAPSPLINRAPQPSVYLQLSAPLFSEAARAPRLLPHPTLDLMLVDDDVFQTLHTSRIHNQPIPPPEATAKPFPGL